MQVPGVAGKLLTHMSCAAPGLCVPGRLRARPPERQRPAVGHARARAQVLMVGGSAALPAAAGAGGGEPDEEAEAVEVAARRQPRKRRRGAGGALTVRTPPRCHAKHRMIRTTLKARTSAAPLWN
jgi:hypothetical protein